MGRVEYRNANFKAGMTLKTRFFIEYKPYRLSVNVGHNFGVIALHFNWRFNEKMLIINSHFGGHWQEAAEETYFPFKAGQYCELTVTFDKNEFDIWVNDEYHTNYPNKLEGEEYDLIWFDGGLKVTDISIRPN